MNETVPLQPGRYYHLYHRGNNHENLFREERNYRYFLEQYAKYIRPIADTYAYCLLKNHFHVIVRIKTEDEWRRGLVQTSGVLTKIEVPAANATKTPEVSIMAIRAFGNLFNAYAKAINKIYSRTGRLFEESFKRIEVNSDTYFTNLIFYIHFNPQKHGFVRDFRKWPWSSYGAMQMNGVTNLKRRDVLNWFDGTTRFEQFHQGAVDEKMMTKLIADDFD